ncbi:hypothetical protein ElyMa_005880100 [Elysia marginata]|uniref:Uncharacterized protein n=1 Tax=Elysia marginata TaxID=1093978 RepID=A0AAV4G3R4_9GAST|nr:hypothetical protein ElyMa_005880100 [Elysia marginata]
MLISDKVLFDERSGSSQFDTALVDTQPNLLRSGVIGITSDHRTPVCVPVVVRLRPGLQRSEPVTLGLPQAAAPDPSARPLNTGAEEKKLPGFLKGVAFLFLFYHDYLNLQVLPFHRQAP